MHSQLPHFLVKQLICVVTFLLLQKLEYDTKLEMVKLQLEEQVRTNAMLL